MKTRLLTFAVFAVMMAFTACTSEEIVYVEKTDAGFELEAGEGVVSISLSEDMQTRAARPITSSEAGNNVNRIAFKFMKDGTTEDKNVSLVGVLDGDGQVDNTDVKTGNVLVISSGTNEINIKFQGMTKGSYDVIAYAYNCAGDDDYSFPHTMAESKEYAEPIDVSVDGTVEEIFAGGKKNVYVNQYNMFSEVLKIELKRQVAGMLAYLSDIPVFVENKKVSKITISNQFKVPGIRIPASFLDNDYNGLAGSDAATVDYLTFDMEKADNYDETDLIPGDYYKFTKDKDSGKRFLLAEGMNEVSYQGLECSDNTLFGSCFLLPFDGRKDLSVLSNVGATLNICFWEKTAEGAYELIKNVALRNGGSSEDSINSDSYQFGIHCNNFYSIGEKTSADDTDNPLNIDEISGYDNAEVTIDQEWSGKHDLVK